MTTPLRFIARLLVAACLPTALPAAGLPAVEQFFSKPEFEMLKLSPNGTSLALRGMTNGTEYLAVIDLKTMQPRPLGDFKDSHLENYWWKNDDLILLLVEGTTGFYSFKLLDLKTGKATDHRQLNAKGYEVVHTLPDDADNVLVTALSGNKANDLQKLNLRDGKVTVAQACPSHGETWILDKRGEPIAVLGNEDKTALLFWRSKPTDKWQRRELGLNTDPQLVITYAHPDQKRLLAWRYQPNGPARIVALDPATMSEEVVFESPEVDPDEIEHWGDNNLTARSISYETDRPRRQYLDAGARDLMDTIDRSLPDTVNEIITTSTDGKIMVVGAWSEVNFGRFYILDMRAGRLQILGDRYPELNGVKMSPSRLFNFKARDGTALNGRLYSPAGAIVKPPLILFVGPGITNVRADYSSTVLPQLLVSRGYAVARINYRGVTGFGRAFESAGDKQLGTGMPHDLEDGVRWLISQGLVDEKRIALYGRSWGGLIGLQALLHSSLFSAWINVNTPMNSHGLNGGDVLYSERDKERIMGKLGGESALFDYLETINPKETLSGVKMPSFHYYFRNPGDNTLLYEGDIARKYFEKSTLPHVFIRGRPFSTPREYYFGTDARYRAENIEIENQVLNFLAKYFPVPAAP